ncbi:unnamed protein product [Tilletia controversa]|nr:unnamed protein product [Tilletia controversa]
MNASASASASAPGQATATARSMQPQQQVAMPSIFLPRSHRTSQISTSLSQFSQSNLAHLSTRRLIDSHASQIEVLRRTGAHLPSGARQRLEQDALRIQNEIERRAASENAQGVASQQQQQQAQVTPVDQLQGAISHLHLDDSVPSQNAIVQLSESVSPNLASLPFTSNNHAHSFQRRCSGQGPILLLQPDSDDLADAEALQAVEELRVMDNSERAQKRKLQAQQKQEERVMDIDSVCYNPDQLFGGDDGNDDEDDGDENDEEAWGRNQYLDP